MSIHHPHDNLFKSAFGKKIVTEDFLLNRLPPEILSKIDIGSLERQNNSFVDEKLKAYYSDLVFKVKTKEGDGYLFFLLEHQTKEDPLMPLRLLEYDVAIMRYDVEQQQKEHIKNRDIRLPVIINFVLYAGEEYSSPKKLLDAFKTPELLYKMFEQNFLIHLKKEEESTLMKDGKGALAEILLREARRKDFCDFLAKHPKIGTLINESAYVDSAIMYILDRDPHDVDKVLEKLVNLDSKIKDMITSGLQRMVTQSEEKGIQLGIIKGKREGIREGIREGENKGKLAIAKQMLAEDMDKALISRVTGLSMNEIDALQG